MSNGFFLLKRCPPVAGTTGRRGAVECRVSAHLKQPRKVLTTVSELPPGPAAYLRLHRLWMIELEFNPLLPGPKACVSGPVPHFFPPGSTDTCSPESVLCWAFTLSTVDLHGLTVSRPDESWVWSENRNHCFIFQAFSLWHVALCMLAAAPFKHSEKCHITGQEHSVT